MGFMHHNRAAVGRAQPSEAGVAEALALCAGRQTVLVLTAMLVLADLD